MKLSVLAIDKILFKGKVESVSAPTFSGIVQILENHIPLIAPLKIGVLKVIENNGKELKFEIKRGILDVRADNKVVVLLR